MRQRNDTGYAHEVTVWPTEEHPEYWPFTVGPGEETDFPVRISTFTLLPEREPEPVRKRKDAAAAADMEVGEPQ